MRERGEGEKERRRDGENMSLEMLSTAQSLCLSVIYIT